MAAISEIRALSEGELFEEFELRKGELFNLRFQLASGQLENTSRINVIKKDIARIKTVLRERQLARELLQEDSNA